MSEFTKLSKRVNDYCVLLGNLEKNIENVSYSEVKRLSAELSELEMKFSHDCDEHAKYLQKVDTTDPITNNPRYGENMKKKIFDLAVVIEGQKPRFASTKDILRKKETELSLKNPPPELNSEVQSVLASGTVFASTPNLVTDNTEEEEKKAVEEMHQLAERVRNVKRKKNEFKSLLIQSLPRLVSSFNDPSHRVQMETAIESLKINLGWPFVGKFMLGILDRIVSHPDDGNIRKIRVSHPVIMEKLMKYQGSLGLVSSMGFHLDLESQLNDDHNGVVSEDTPTSLRLLDELYDKYSSLEIKDDPESQLVCSLEKEFLQFSVERLLNFCDAIAFTPYFILREPAIDTNSTEGFKQWIQWFDDVQECRNKLRDSLNGG